MIIAGVVDELHPDGSIPARCEGIDDVLRGAATLCEEMDFIREGLVLDVPPLEMGMAQGQGS